MKSWLICVAGAVGVVASARGAVIAQANEGATGPWSSVSGSSRPEIKSEGPAIGAAALTVDVDATAGKQAASDAQIAGLSTVFLDGNLNSTKHRDFGGVPGSTFHVFAGDSRGGGLGDVGSVLIPAERGEAIPAPAVSGSPCGGADINRDGVVNSVDLNLLLGKFGAGAPAGSAAAAADVRVDGTIDGQDLTALLRAFGQACR